MIQTFLPDRICLCFPFPEFFFDLLIGFSVFLRFTVSQSTKMIKLAKTIKFIYNILS